jgi:ABC-type multidrug transport system ATPase subunit
MMRPMQDPPIVASGIAFSYGRPVVEGFSIAVAPGEVVALLGANGAGKTTILRMLAGELRPRAGRLAILGGDPRRPAIRRSMGVVREVPALHEYLTASESVRYALDVYGVPRVRRDDVRGVFERFGLADAARKRVSALSKGTTRRLELAQLVLVDAPVWLLDEPDSGLDPGGARLFRSEIAAARARGRAILFSSHAVLEAALCADRIVVLRGGRVAFEGTREETMNRLDKRAFVATGGGPGLAAALGSAAAAAGASLSEPQVPVADLEALLFEDRPR